MANNMANSFRLEIQGFSDGIRRAQAKAKAGVMLVGKTGAAKMEAHAKENASWEDDTGIARDTIVGESFWENENTIRVQVSGNTDYFKYLEYGLDGRFSILNPTVDELSPEILRALRGVMG